MKKVKQAVVDYLNDKPEKEFATGKYVTKIGSSLVHYVDTWNVTTKHTMSIDEFHKRYVLGVDY